KFEADEPSMTAAEKAEREAAIQADFREYKALLQTQQADIDAKERLVMKQIFTEIDEAVAKIGARDGYYLILEGNTRSGAIYYAASLDMSQRVIDELNGES
ncbi:MAG: hypothetical protein GWP08_20610, partial [Nitrospiraceae bacterium]|nr:hypothetical protein [Nitrospiraceae bacterium]